MTARHIKQVASNPKVAQINLMQHQGPDIPASRHKKKSFMRPRPQTHKNDASDRQQASSYHNNNYNKSFDARMFTRVRSDDRSVEIQYILEVSRLIKEIPAQVLPQVWKPY